MSQRRPEGGRLLARLQAANRRTRQSRSRPTMASPSLTTPPPPPTDHTQQPLPSHQDYSDIFSFLSPATMPTGGPPHDFGGDGAMPHPPPPPQAPAETNAPRGTSHSQPPADTPNQHAQDQQHEGDEEHDESNSDSGEEDSEDEPDREDMDRSWYAIVEEKREHVDDELRYWTEIEEHSAHDHEYWQKEAFKDMDDPEIQPGPHGRIDLAIDHFNGTKEKPNRETTMRSEVVTIGGYDWRLKFYPKGNNTDYLSVYVENVMMQQPEWQATEEFTNPPLPFLASSEERPKKRRYVAAQVCVVLYNPTEPRQYEYKIDAHQFTKDSPDYGWTRFTHMRRRDLGMRNNYQRAPLLQDDKLAFKAYIRVIEDPTGCLWDHSSSRYNSTIAATGLRPFARLLPILAADIVLLHFAPFRAIVQRWKQDNDSSKFVSWINILLWKMVSRERSEMYGEPVDSQQSDTVMWLQRAAKYLQQEEGLVTAKQLLGTLDSAQGAAVSGERLKTRTHASVQAAVDAHKSALETPALLTLELERHYFDTEKRAWERVTNKVDIQDEIKVGSQRYKLFGFITHCGDLSSNKFKTYVRPSGPGTIWYGYSSDRVTCMTHKQALEKRCGCDEAKAERPEHPFFSFGRDRRGMQIFRDDLEVAHVVFYVREDYAEATFAPVKTIEWEPPAYVKGGERQKDEVPQENGAPVVEEKEVPQEESTKRTSISSESSAYTAGCATPTHWFMDEDGDVVMSDQEDDLPENGIAGEESVKVDSKEPELVHRTIDNLGCSYYSGEMQGNKYHGSGHLITLNGDEYRGTFSHSNKHGTGKMTYAANGDVYDGEWSENQRHGRGKYTEASTGNVFDGTWKHDKKSGAFTLTGTVTEEDRGVCGICYEREMNTAFYDCGHVVACYSCAGQIDDCPVCRRRIVSRLQLFGVKVSLE